MKNKLLASILVISILLMSISFVGSIPPQASKAELGYEIRIPQAEFLRKERDVNAHIHIFNVSNGLPISPDNSNVGCVFHLYDQTGTPVIEQNMEEDVNGLEWELFIDGGNFTNVGIMTFMIYCNDSSAGGFVSSSIEVTETGQTPKDGIIIIVFSLLFIFLCFEMLGLLLWSILHLLELSFDAKDLILNVSSYIALFAFYILQTRFLTDEFMSDFSVFLLEIGAVTTIIIPIIAFVVCYIKQNMKTGDHN